MKTNYTPCAHFSVKLTQKNKGLPYSSTRGWLDCLIRNVCSDGVMTPLPREV